MKINYNYYEQDKKVSLNYTQQKRLDMINQGAYDGRFCSKVIKNKKKENNKNWARQK
jgi:hypothetical protein